jgi:hypothetical protein
MNRQSDHLWFIHSTSLHSGSIWDAAPSPSFPSGPLLCSRRWCDVWRIGDSASRFAAPGPARRQGCVPRPFGPSSPARQLPGPLRGAWLAAGERARGRVLCASVLVCNPLGEQGFAALPGPGACVAWSRHRRHQKNPVEPGRSSIYRRCYRPHNFQFRTWWAPRGKDSHSAQNDVLARSRRENVGQTRHAHNDSLGRNTESRSTPFFCIVRSASPLRPSSASVRLFVCLLVFLQQLAPACPNPGAASRRHPQPPQTCPSTT